MSATAITKKKKRVPRPPAMAMLSPAAKQLWSETIELIPGFDPDIDQLLAPVAIQTNR